MVLRLLILKHIRNLSYETLEREVRANLVYRDFTRVGADKVLGPQALKQIRFLGGLALRLRCRRCRWARDAHAGRDAAGPR
jgi:Transposase domain (DUF772)